MTALRLAIRRALIAAAEMKAAFEALALAPDAARFLPRAGHICLALEGFAGDLAAAGKPAPPQSSGKPEQSKNLAVGSEDRFFLLSTKHSPGCEYAMWWAPESIGYTSDLEQAGEYSAAEILGPELRRSLGVSFEAIPVECALEQSTVSRRIPWTLETQVALMVVAVGLESEVGA